ncbi:dol-P-Glc:Glc(2)Man(9)GlcNAc(2)-PP-Dol alpha-1,2-glucosyltransferase isoform X2 [Erinaceus europaeus]|uniref:Dol-P-Glc:Glc(2)Man(9)GlcNAc(2)-PP-Dol alpha-1,2-glucosyltransferase n=1 Tax=Erinaceus europaeus TaxID=9365 RepID=A0ABM3XP73_ERIEU|nr:dol-P-Glc:Glc(2)Man(9)GlcNAc(2)-PP-Dol alpha-1,2-glucosyltransferase isoform X2 [Erinaceus europaeus]
MEGHLFSAALSGSFLASCLLFAAVGRALREPYMDEVFHLPQAQRFCQGHFTEWDPMITTLPGLYLLSVGVVKPAGWLLGWPEQVVCSIGALRFVNLLFSAGNFYLLHLLLCRTQPRHKAWCPRPLLQASSGIQRVLCTVALAAFPPLYFFNFLYYTDVGSVFFTLFSYLMCLYGNHKTAALLGAGAVLFRQTNVVWVAFCAGSVCAPKLAEAWQAELRVRPAGGGPLQRGWALARFLGIFLGRREQLWALLPALWPYALLLLLFSAFVLLNGGVAVGDRDSHEACLHLPQLFYFCSFTLLFSCPHLATPSRLRAFLGWARRRRALFLLLTVACMLLVWRFTYAHKYLLADNRHYTFYVWRRLLQRHPAVKYLLAPAYVFAGWAILDSLRAKSIFWTLTFLVCLLAATVPQRLLEFRYFILPYLIYRLNVPLPPTARLVCELAAHTAVNALTFYVFLNKPFRWPDSPDLQRFMW